MLRPQLVGIYIIFPFFWWFPASPPLTPLHVSPVLTPFFFGRWFLLGVSPSCPDLPPLVRVDGGFFFFTACPFPPPFPLPTRMFIWRRSIAQIRPESLKGRTKHSCLPSTEVSSFSRLIFLAFNFKWHAGGCTIAPNVSSQVPFFYSVPPLVLRTPSLVRGRVVLFPVNQVLPKWAFFLGFF